MSDGSSLLLRLHLEGVNIEERAKEQARKWQNRNEDFSSLFYESHACFTNLLAGYTESEKILRERMNEYLENGEKTVCN